VPVVVHVSDIHFGAQIDELAESLLVDIAGQQPALVVVSGDLTQRARASEFTAARAYLDRMPAPVLTVVGNHDIPLTNVAKRLLNPTARYERYICAELDPVTSLPGLVVLGLGSMPPWRWKSAHVSQRQAELARRTFGQAPPDAWPVLVTHHPVLSAPRGGLLGRARLVAAAAESGVAVLLAGHTHHPAVELVTVGTAGASRHVVSVVTGTAISRRTRNVGNAYVVLEFAEQMVPGARLTVQVREPLDTAWATTRVEQFEYGRDGLVTCA
jgi:3',5'-cyclic AMP phosphodiesterase CpdA